LESFSSFFAEDRKSGILTGFGDFSHCGERNGGEDERGKLFDFYLILFIPTCTLIRPHRSSSHLQPSLSELPTSGTVLTVRITRDFLELLGYWPISLKNGWLGYLRLQRHLPQGCY